MESDGCVRFTRTAHYPAADTCTRAYARLGYILLLVIRPDAGPVDARMVDDMLGDLDPEETYGIASASGPIMLARRTEVVHPGPAGLGATGPGWGCVPFRTDALATLMAGAAHGPAMSCDDMLVAAGIRLYNHLPGMADAYAFQFLLMGPGVSIVVQQRVVDGAEQSHIEFAIFDGDDHGHDVVSIIFVDDAGPARKLVESVAYMRRTDPCEHQLHYPRLCKKDGEAFVVSVPIAGLYDAMGDDPPLRQMFAGAGISPDIPGGAADGLSAHLGGRDSP